MTEIVELERNRDDVRLAVLSGIVKKRTFRQRRNVILVAGAGLALAAAAGVGATTLFRPDPVFIDNTVLCYQKADLSSEQQVVQGEAPLPVVDACDLVWREGGWGQAHGLPSNAPHPRIAQCLDPSGIGAGFPLWDDSETAEQVCDRLGLPVWDGSLQGDGSEP